jgi:hypothetical protein
MFSSKKSEHNREKHRCYICDPGGHLKSLVARRVREALTKNKTCRTLEYLGCDIITYRSFIENKFKE